MSAAYRLATPVRGCCSAATMDPPGAIAQLGERLDRTQEAAGSSPASSIAGIPHGYWVCAFAGAGPRSRISSRGGNIQSASDLSPRRWVTANRLQTRGLPKLAALMRPALGD